MPDSRNKGHNYEREIAAFYRELFGEAKRGLQSRDGDEAPDVIVPQLPGIWVECKRYKTVGTGNVYRWWRKAVKDAGERDAVLHVRADREEALVVLSQEHWRTICERLFT